MLKNFDELIAKVKTGKSVRVAVAQADDTEVIKTVKMALDEGIATFYLVGEKEPILKKLEEVGLSEDGEKIKVLHTDDHAAAAAEAVKLVRNGEADVVMKGLIHTATFLKAVLNKEWGLRPGEKALLSHVGVFKLPLYDRFLLLSDAAMIPAPTLEQKVTIINYAVKVAHALEIEEPKVAVLAAVETVSTAMPATIEAAALAVMNRRKQIKGCIVDGPLALDNALSEEAARHKGIESPVAGKADVLIVPDIEAGNILYKSFTFGAGAKMAGVVVGATAPVVLTSRADSAESKFYSIALAVKMAQV
jgi:phosphate butyryltransferase